MAGESEYRHVCDIAKGGMARVSLVVRQKGQFCRPYAMKRFHSHLEDDPAARTMFIDEGRLAGLLRHPNVVSVLDVGEDAEGPYLLMDYVEGFTLASMLKALEPGSIPVAICLSILVQVARGLAAAHELRAPDGTPLELVHRDISPQNILVDLDGVALIADFGIARAAQRETQTELGVLKGKSGYIAPEAYRFDERDHRSDLFSLGVVAYEILTGLRLYREQKTTLVAKRILSEPAPDLGLARPDVPDELVELGFRLLAKQPDQRPDSAAEVVQLLEEILDDEHLRNGRSSLRDFVREHLDDSEIESRRHLIATLDAPATDIEINSDLDIKPDHDLEPTTKIRTGVPRAALAGVFAAIVLAAASLGIYLTSSSRDDPVKPQVGKAEEAIEPTAANVPVEDIAIGAPPAQEADPPTAERPAPAARPRPTRRRRPRRQQPRTGSGSTVPVIDVY